MQTKLTLRLDSELIERAKVYAHATGRSVSQLVSDYFAVLENTRSHDPNTTVPDLVAALHGCLRPSNPNEAEEVAAPTEADYHAYRDQKYGGQST